MDKVLFIDDGKVIAFGTHEQLCKTCIDYKKMVDLQKLEDAYYQLTNKQIAKYFRPPKGDFDKKSLLCVSNLGYKNVFWSRRC